MSVLGTVATQRRPGQEREVGQGFKRSNFQHKLKPQSPSGPAGCDMPGR